MSFQIYLRCIRTEENNSSFKISSKILKEELVDPSGIEPLTSWMQIRRSPSWAKDPFKFIKWWARRDLNLRPHAYQACALTSWATSPSLITDRTTNGSIGSVLIKERKNMRATALYVCTKYNLRKEVIQPQVPLRLPCYDFVPVADPTVVACLRS
jgi:hypothetical protein